MKKGFSLTELIIYMLMSMIMLGIITVVFVSVSDSYKKTMSTFDVQREVEAAADQIRRDLNQSSLNSIVVYPSGSERNPGVSMISPCQEETFSKTTTSDSFVMTQNGGPRWGRYVFYTVLPRETKSGEQGSQYQGRMGNLVRWVWELDDKDISPYPSPTNVLPSQFSTKRAPFSIILRGVPLPTSPELQGLPHFKTNGVDYGGFQVAFVRQSCDKTGKVTSEYLTGVNPSKAVSPTDTGNVSELVQVNITNIYISELSGKLSAYSFSFTSYPKN
ncbi:MAG: hypothetical protein LWY06_10090 [Firmicutes bacterium]|nr:hypothetical protein [Bacillota bacterium]